MRLPIVAILAAVCAFTPVAVAQTTGPTLPGARASQAQVKAPRAKARSAACDEQKRVVRRGKATSGKAVATKAGPSRAPAPKA